MKKLLMLTVVTVGMMFCAHAQESGFGVRGGMNISSISMDDDDDYKSKIGFNIGLIYDWGISEHFYIQPGLYFTTRGTKCEVNDDDYKYEEKWNLNYLQLPILASYRLSLTDNITWHINAGPYVAYGIGGKLKMEDDDDKYDFKAFDSDEGDLKRFDAGLSFGTGVSIEKFYVGLTYELGLTNLGDSNFDAKNRNFSIGIGYNF